MSETIDFLQYLKELRQTARYTISKSERQLQDLLVRELNEKVSSNECDLGQLERIRYGCGAS